MGTNGIEHASDLRMPEEGESASSSIEREWRNGIALKVKDFVSRSVAASVSSIPTKGEMEIFRQFEENKMELLTDRIYEILCEVAIPAAVAYVRKRFPVEGSQDFPRFDNVMFRPEYSLSSDENILSGTLPPSPGYL